MHKKNIYFDNNSSTPISENVLSEMTNAHISLFGNPSSITKPGRNSKNHLNNARKTVASFFSCQSSEITFTSSGTEAINSLICGICKNSPGQIITTKIEHKSILECIKSLPHKKNYLQVDKNGIFSTEELKEKLNIQTSAIVLSLVNNEIGSILPIKEIANIAQSFNTPLIIDGVAALGKMPIILHPGITAMAFSGHKIHGPKGTGFFYLKKNTPFSPLLLGGMQEHNKRAGTENTPGILGLAKAIEEISFNDAENIKTLRNTFEQEIKKLFPDSEINCEENRVCNVSNIHFKDVDGDHLLIFLDTHNISASLGSACTSGSLEPSHVLLGLGHSPKYTNSCLRFSFSKFNTLEDIHACLKTLAQYKIFLTEQTALYF
ncbi:MAG: Cysteine desulfurase IscS [Chlamydiia bacterium]|nr:Cysteine desulfurase IscS [Chlamydiia bacterium]